LEQVISITTALGIFILLICIYITYLHLKVYFSEPVNNIVNYYWGIGFIHLFIAALFFAILVILRPLNPIMYIVIFLIYYNYSLVIIAIVALKLSFEQSKKSPKLHKITKLAIRISFIFYQLILLYYVFENLNCLVVDDNLFFMRFNNFNYSLFFESYTFLMVLFIYIIFPKDYPITGKFFKGSFGLLALAEGIRIIDLILGDNILIKIFSLSIITIAVITLQLSVLLEYKKNIAFIKYNRKIGRRKEDRINGI